MSARRDEGTVTAEVAILLPGVVLLLCAVLATATAGLAQLRCTDAARTAARLAARGEPAAEVSAAALRVAPAGARVQVSTGDDVTARVEAEVHLPLPGAGPIDVVATAVARSERALE